MIRYYDIGLNLFSRQFPDPEKILKNAADQGVSCILTGSDMQENEQINLFTKAHPGVFGTAGIHPHNADEATPDDFKRIRQIVMENPQVVAIGECGLDYDRMFSTRENQVRCLEKHIELAMQIQKPMFLHEREAADDLTACFRSAPEMCKKAVVHCFTGNLKTLERYLDMGFMISITGWICDDRRAKALREAVSRLPTNRVMIETDAPYLTPKNVPGLSKVNVPENVQYVAKDLAYYMGIEEEELILCARENTERFFGLPRIKKLRITDEFKYQTMAADRGDACPADCSGFSCHGKQRQDTERGTF